jgi:hypothetical protein
MNLALCCGRYGSPLREDDGKGEPCCSKMAPSASTVILAKRESRDLAPCYGINGSPLREDDGKTARE